MTWTCRRVQRMRGFLDHRMTNKHASVRVGCRQGVSQDEALSGSGSRVIRLGCLASKVPLYSKEDQVCGSREISNGNT
jgi:hypothetical protein